MKRWIGVDERAGFVYSTMLRRVRWQIGDLAAALGLAESELRQVLVRLEADRLVVRSADDARCLRAVEPALALPSLAASRLKGGTRKSELPAAGAMEAFIAAHERVIDRFGEREPLHGVDELTSAAERTITRARFEVLFAVRQYVPDSFEFSRQLVEYLLRRGVRVRAVWSAGFTRLPPVQQHGAWLKVRDIRPRVMPSVSARVAVVDGSVALAVDDTGCGHLEHRSEVVGALHAGAQRQWATGGELRDSLPVAPNGMSQQRYEQVLRMLADGLTDEAVARRLGVSVRTVRNDVASTMSALQADSRFQAGARAAQLGLI